VNLIIKPKPPYMKNSKLPLAGTLLCLVMTFFVILIAFTSCKKSNDNGSSFAGSYYGTLISGMYSEADTISIPSGSSSSITMNSKTGIGSTYSIHGTVSGNNLTIASQSVTVSGLGNTYTVSGTGTLSNSTLVIHYNFVSASNVSTSWTFTGSKN
jgi:hypothetical protein